MLTTDRMDPRERTWGEPIYLTRSAVADLPDDLRRVATSGYRDILDTGCEIGDLTSVLRAVTRLSELGGYRDVG